MWLAVRKCAHLSAGWAQKLAQSRVLTTVRTYHIVNGKRQNPLGNFYAKRRYELPTPLLRRYAIQSSKSPVPRERVIYLALELD
jgi:hypothetical protein